MTLDECYAANQGKSLLIPGGGAGNEGQCLQWVETVTHDVYGIPYIYTPGAIDFWNKFDALGLGQWFNKITDGLIRKGDVVVFNQQVGSVYGHIDVAMQDGTTNSFLGADSNWGGNKTVHLVQHNGSQYVLGSLRLKGVDMDYPNLGDVQNITNAYGWQRGADGKTQAAAIAQWTTGTNNPYWQQGAAAVWKALNYELQKYVIDNLVPKSAIQSPTKAQQQIDEIKKIVTS